MHLVYVTSPSGCCCFCSSTVGVICFDFHKFITSCARSAFNSNWVKLGKWKKDDDDDDDDINYSVEKGATDNPPMPWHKCNCIFNDIALVER